MSFKNWFIQDNILCYNEKVIPNGWKFSDVVSHIKKYNSIPYKEVYNHRQVVSICGDERIKYLAGISLVREKK